MPDNTITSKLLQKSIKSLRQNLTELDIDSFLKHTLETVMQIERDEYLAQIDDPVVDKGNGYYGRAFNNLSKNSMLINIPRTRNGGLSLNTLELLKINREKLDEITLSLYKKGMTFNDIQDFLSEVFVTVKPGNSYSKEGIFVVIGVREDLKRELLILDINPTESAKTWNEFLLNLRDQRGVEQIDLFVADGLNYLEDELAKVYSNTSFQKCVVHKMRNILNKTKPKDKLEVGQDLKYVFDNFESTSATEQAKEKMAKFLNKWQKVYPSFKNQMKEGNIEYYFTYINYHPRVRRMIYTTNSIENLNRQIRKTTKNKLSFESPDNLLDYLFMIIKDFEEKNYMQYPVTEYKYFGLFQPNNNQIIFNPDTI